MQRTFSRNFGNDVVEIFVGEHYATNKPEIITTLLGSCIGVCLIDNVNKVYGLNHFLLPDILADNSISDSSKFGTFSMELLLNDMFMLGSKKINMEAKVFGGGKVLHTSGEGITVDKDNIKFIHDFLENESIKIISEDVGGNSGRKIFFDTRDGSVYLKRV